MVKTSDVLLVLLAILFPPASTAILTGCSCDTLITILLTVLGYIPGHIHAFYIIYKNMKAEERYGKGGYQYLGNAEWGPIEGHAHNIHGPGHAAPPPPGYSTTYGTA
ncbi:hypothetical protein JCM8097_007229 [Rhodosporidiobolus ruineniae]